MFSDDEARKAIIDLRQRVDAQKATAEAIEKRLTDENNQLRRSLLDLQNQIETGRIAHAYLFCGSRGTGKTTTAKLLARAINCSFDGHTTSSAFTAGYCACGV